jgi:hypothetical protein
VSTPIDATVFGVASLRRTLPCVALALVALFVALRPEASAGLGLLARAGYWSLHVAIGLGGLAVASVIARRPPWTRLPLPLSLLLTGLLGALAAAPAFWLAEHWWPVPGGEAPDDWLDAFAAAGVWQGMLAEALEVAPAFVTCWLAVNLPLILARAGPAPTPPADPPPEPPPAKGASGGARRSAPATGPPLPECLERLPAAVGRDLVAISSDLHYLHVHTTRGRAMILGNLGDAAAALGDLGMRVHRSHWVAHAHVRRVQIAGNKAWCLMSTGLRVPVSRRKRRETRNQYGQGPVAADAATGSRRDVA